MNTMATPISDQDRLRQNQTLRRQLTNRQPQPPQRPGLLARLRKLLTEPVMP